MAKFKYDYALVKKKDPAVTNFVFNGITKYAVSGHPDVDSAVENCKARNSKAIDLKLDVRYFVGTLEEGAVA